MFYRTGIFLGDLSVAWLRATSTSDWGVSCLDFPPLFLLFFLKKYHISAVTNIFPLQVLIFGKT